MNEPSEPVITEANRTDNGVVIAFADGKIAFYSAALLYATLPSAQEIDPSLDEDI